MNGGSFCALDWNWLGGLLHQFQLWTKIVQAKEKLALHLIDAAFDDVDVNKIIFLESQEAAKLYATGIAAFGKAGRRHKPSVTFCRSVEQCDEHPEIGYVVHTPRYALELAIRPT